MKKEILLKTKKDLVQKELQYTGLYMTDEEIQCFSANQLKILCKIMKQNQKMEYDRSAFLAISTTEALCKENGKIIDFEEVVALDAKYITEWSLREDIKILWKTVLIVLKGKGAV